MTLGRPTYTLDTAMDLVVDFDEDEHECPEHSDCDHPDHDEELAR